MIKSWLFVAKVVNTYTYNLTDSKMADNGYDFFAPQPRPVPRAKNTMFDLVPDPFTGKTLELTGDHRRGKRLPQAKDSEPGVAAPRPSPSVPVQESFDKDVVTDVEAEKWSGVGNRGME